MYIYKRYVLLVMWVTIVYSGYRVFFYQPTSQAELEGLKLAVFSVANKASRNAERFQRSARVNGLPVQLLTFDGTDSDAPRSNIGLIEEALQPYKQDAQLIVVVVNGHDVLFNADAAHLVDRFLQLKAGIVFSADQKCRPADLQTRSSHRSFIDCFSNK